MSSLRPAKVAAALLQLIGGSLAEPAEPTGPPCSCEGCSQAWWRNQPRHAASARAGIQQEMRRAGAA
jgi:hypothetical protein